MGTTYEAFREILKANPNGIKFIDLNNQLSEKRALCLGQDAMDVVACCQNFLVATYDSESDLVKPGPLFEVGGWRHFEFFSPFVFFTYNDLKEKVVKRMKEYFSPEPSNLSPDDLINICLKRGWIKKVNNLDSYCIEL